MIEKQLKKIYLNFTTSNVRGKIIKIINAVLIPISIGAFTVGVYPFAYSCAYSSCFGIKEIDYASAALAIIPIIILATVRMLKSKNERGLFKIYKSTSLLSGKPGVNFKNSIRPRTGERIDFYGDDFALTSPELNKWIANCSHTKSTLEFRVTGEYIPYRNNSSDEHRLGKLKEYAIAEKINSGSKIFNGKKLRLASNLFNNVNTLVSIEKTDYVSSLITDQFAFKKIYNPGSGLIINDGYSNFLEKEKSTNEKNTIFKLKSLATTDASNQIGVSTLAFTKDGNIPIVIQTYQNAQSQGSIAPSGSGSLDFEDTHKIPSRHDFWSLIRYGASRELFEECGIQNRVDINNFQQNNIFIFAASRMIHRAGKPEFFCIAKLPYYMSEINSMKVSLHERAFTEETQRYAPEPIKASKNLKEEIIRISSYYLDERNLSELISSNLSVSYPLQHGLELLKEAMLTDETEKQITKFLSDHFKN